RRCTRTIPRYSPISTPNSTDCWSAFQRASSGNAKNIASPRPLRRSLYFRLVWVPAPLRLGLFGGEVRLFRPGSMCASTEPAKDCTCLFDSRAGSAKPIPTSRLTLREVFGDGGIRLLANVRTPTRLGKIDL